MNKQSGSIGLCFVFLLACVAVYAVGYYGCNCMEDFDDSDLQNVESIQLTDIYNDPLEKVK